ncbi:hypothetical protein KIN20_007985 [Parelaphostrongylus tenuis]|uniref:Uncharacterized protein n=1 Tax=Parelaphostrongylus tenuis TaxID=148309 RepID=A0AAD5QJI7_PARTN|nr:hypothetical protein KIN20_007985 [Parelaphostrongylus tenuis]
MFSRMPRLMQRYLVSLQTNTAPHACDYANPRATNNGSHFRIGQSGDYWGEVSMRQQVQNIVGSCDVRFPIRLEALNIMHARFSSYEPEIFPGPDLSYGETEGSIP